MEIVRAFIEGLSGCQCHLLSTLHLHHNGALQHVNKRMCIVSMNDGPPAGRMLDCDHQRCYGASDDEIASIGKLLTERWLHRRRCQFAPMEPIDAQAETAEAAERPESFAYTVRS